MKRFFGILGLLLAAMVCAAQVKPVVVTPTGRVKLTTDDALDAKVYVDDSGVLLGSTTGTAKHEEISISGLPAQTSPGSGTLLLASESGVLKKVDVSHLPTGSLSADALFDAKGDIGVGTGANTAAKLSVGSNGQVLQAASGETTGLKWVTPTTVATDNIFDAKGDLSVGTADNTAAKLTVGSNGQFLQAASGEATGLKWAAAGMPAVTEVFTSSGTWTKPTGAVAVEVLCIGGGGGGGAGRRGTSGSSVSGGGGGGGGGFSRAYFLASQLSATVSVTRGAGGAGAAAQTNDNTNGNNATSGGTSSFGSYVLAVGGSGGTGGASSSGTGGSGGIGIVSSGANGGTGAPTTPNQNLEANYAPTGGGGASGVNFGTGNYAARGGGTIVLATTGWTNNAGTYPGTSPSAGGSFLYFGQGGGGGSNYQNGAAGGDYGGGGGGGGGAVNGTNSGAGGAGANGVVVVITYF